MPANPFSTSIVYLALGTNLGDRPGNLRDALAALPPAVTVLERSPVYETPPWGVTDQPDFLNMVIKGETRQEPQELLRYLPLVHPERVERAELQAHQGRPEPELVEVPEPRVQVELGNPVATEHLARVVRQVLLEMVPLVLLVLLEMVPLELVV